METNEARKQEGERSNGRKGGENRGEAGRKDGEE